jgi:hypothetical protein
MNNIINTRLGETMDSLSVRDEIEKLLSKRPEHRSLLSEVGKNEWQQIQHKIENNFLTKKHYKVDLHWAWEHFNEPRQTVSFVDPVYKYYQYLIHDKKVYFVVEDYLNKFWFYEGDSRFITERIIPELVQLRDYYIVSKKFEWIVCENHHEFLCVSGASMVNKLRNFIERNSEEVIF